jgi:arylsulfatase A-like enzyme
MGDCLKPTNSFSFWYVNQLGGGPYNNAPMVRDGRPITEPGYVTDRITDEALNFIDAHARDARPFYLSVHYTAPHSPWTGHPQDIVDSYDQCPFASCPQEPRHPWAGDLTTRCLGNREMLKGYFAAVTAMDANVGRILRRLEELGLTERTLVIFVSDNGFSCGHHGFWGKGNGTRPRNMYENSIKVLFILSRPGSVPQGRTVDAMVSAYDFFPTLLDYLDLPLPEGRARGAGTRPGRSFLPLLTGRAERVNDKVVVFDEYGPVRMIRTEEWKYTGRYPDGPDDLYHLAEDPDERRNLADDPAHNKVKAELKAEMEAWFARYVTAEHDGLRETY